MTIEFECKNVLPFEWKSVELLESKVFFPLRHNTSY